MRILEDPLYQNIELDLSKLNDRLMYYWYWNLNDFIGDLLNPYNAGGPGVADKFPPFTRALKSGLYLSHGRSNPDPIRIESGSNPDWPILV